jgi:T-complex protein 1 subunit alpha
LDTQVATLRSYHYAAQTDESRADLRHSGLDLVTGAVRNNLVRLYPCTLLVVNVDAFIQDAGVVEPAISKVKSIRFATEAAITILRIDDRVTLNPAQENTHGR